LFASGSVHPALNELKGGESKGDEKQESPHHHKDGQRRTEENNLGKTSARAIGSFDNSGTNHHFANGLSLVVQEKSLQPGVR